MAVYREPPTCPFCGKVIAEAIYKDYSGYSIMQVPCGDSFERWKFKKHSCKEAKEYWENFYKTPEGKKLKKALMHLGKNMNIEKPKSKKKK